MDRMAWARVGTRWCSAGRTAFALSASDRRTPAPSDPAFLYDGPHFPDRPPAQMEFIKDSPSMEERFNELCTIISRVAFVPDETGTSPAGR